jgi:hypothetical protein
MPKPLKMKLFEVKDPNQWCHFHRSKGHNTSDCLQLKDIMEKLARQGELIKFISRDFYKKFTSRYDGSERKFHNAISKKSGQGSIDPQIGKNHPRGNDDDPSSREHTPTVNVISGGLASDDDMKQARRSYQTRQKFPSVMNVEKKRSRPDEIIAFSEKDRGDVQGPHDDAIILSLKINTHRVKMVLVDTGSSADILYLDAFKKMGYCVENLKKVQTPLVGFTDDTLYSKGVIEMRVKFGQFLNVTTMMMEFLIVI